MDPERKLEGSPEVGAGRIAELKHLEAAERALAHAYRDYANHHHGVSRFLGLAERHLQHAAVLAARLEELGSRPATEADDFWILGPTTELATLINAEHAAERAYHDHLLDLDPESKRLVLSRILSQQEDTLAEVTGERSFLLESLEPR